MASDKSELSRGCGAVTGAVCRVSPGACGAVTAAGGIVGPNGEAGRAGRDNSYGAAVGVDRPSLQNWTNRWEPRASTKGAQVPTADRSAILRVICTY